MNVHAWTSLYDELIAHHSWSHCLGQNTFIAKYIDFKADTRTGSIWSVTFRECRGYNKERWGNKDNDRTISFRELPSKTLVAQIKEFLDDCEDYNMKEKIA
jgi:hypothetical protein